MKTTNLPVFLLSLGLSGCVSLAPDAKSPGLLVQPLLDRLVPADFKGDGEFAERGQYLVLEVKAGGLRKLDSGVWTWTSLEYQRTLKIPVVGGVGYQQEAAIKLGPSAK